MLETTMDVVFATDEVADTQYVIGDGFGVYSGRGILIEKDGYVQAEKFGIEEIDPVLVQRYNRDKSRREDDFKTVETTLRVFTSVNMDSWLLPTTMDVALGSLSDVYFVSHEEQGVIYELEIADPIPPVETEGNNFLTPVGKDAAWYATSDELEKLREEGEIIPAIQI